MKSISRGIAVAKHSRKRNAKNITEARQTGLTLKKSFYAGKPDTILPDNDERVSKCHSRVYVLTDEGANPWKNTALNIVMLTFFGTI